MAKLLTYHSTPRISSPVWLKLFYWGFLVLGIGAFLVSILYSPAGMIAIALLSAAGFFGGWDLLIGLFQKIELRLMDIERHQKGIRDDDPQLSE